MIETRHFKNAVIFFETRVIGVLNRYTLTPKRKQIFQNICFLTFIQPEPFLN